MRHLLLIVLIAAWAVASAQVPSGDEQGEAPQEEVAEENAESADGGADPAEEGPETAEDQATSDAGGSDAADAVEETLPPEAPEIGDEADLEFEPGEEISEDYPVPLPSDI